MNLKRIISVSLKTVLVVLAVEAVFAALIYLLCPSKVDLTFDLFCRALWLFHLRIGKCVGVLVVLFGFLFLIFWLIDLLDKKKKDGDQKTKG